MASSMSIHDFDHLHCTTFSRVRLWDSDGERRPTEWLNEHQLLDELKNVDTGSNLGNKKPRIAMAAATGDPSDEKNPLQMTPAVCEAIIRRFHLPRQLVRVLETDRFHISYHTEYDEVNDNLRAITMLKHAPPLSQNIKCAIRVQLSDLSCFCLLSSSHSGRLDSVLATLARAQSEDGFHPIMLPQIIFEDRFVVIEEWFKYLRTEVKELETATGMIRTGRETVLTMDRRAYLANRNKMLKQQHAVRTELAYCETILTSISKFGASCTRFLNDIEDARCRLGHGSLKNAEMAAYKELIAFTLAECDFTRDKLKELTSRVEAQINVSFSLVAQQDSRVNLFVAERAQHASELAARDSRAMKLIAFMTLIFLPCSLVTSIWDSKLVNLEGDKNWEIYLIVSLVTSVLMTAIGAMFLLHRGPEWAVQPRQEPALNTLGEHGENLIQSRSASPQANFWQR